MRKSNCRRKHKGKKTRRKHKMRYKLFGGSDEDFAHLCGIGDLNQAQQYLQEHPDTNISANDEEAFRLACINGHLSIAQWLIQIKPDIDISVHYDEPFRISCERRHLHVAQWLNEISKELGKSISHYAIIESFKKACESGDLHTAQWLFHIRGEDIHLPDNNHYYFRTVCNKKYVDFARWFMEINPQYEISQKNGEWVYRILGPKNMEKKEKWNRKKSVVFLGSELSGNKNMYKMPNDVLRIVGSYL
jgi:hypothetical protein